MQRYFSKKLDNNYFLINDDDFFHISTVMRMKDNDKIEIVYNNELYIGIIESIEQRKVKVLNKEDIKYDKRPRVTLCVPLLKEQKMDYILQKATELGVNEIIPVILERSIIKLDEKKEDKRLERWSRICKEASEQSKRLDVPTITKVKRIKELNIDGLKIVCSTTEKENNIKKILKTNSEDLVFIMGPEGGISPKEEKILNEIGFISTSLGNRIMRVETVPLYIMSVVNYEYMEWENVRNIKFGFK